MRTILLLVFYSVTLVTAQTVPSIVKDIDPGIPPGVGSDIHMSELNGKLLFFGYPTTQHPRLYSTDGTSAGTVVLAEVGHNSNTDEWGFFKHNNELYWVGQDSAHYGYDVQLWKTNGTANGTVAVKTFDNNGNSAFTSQSSFIAANNTLFFMAWDTSGSGLWRTDGTEAGTYQLIDDVIAPEIYNVANNKLIINKDNDLYATDGTIAGTQMIHSPVFPAYPRDGSVLGNYLYFGHFDELWRTDGTSAGTAFIKTGYEAKAIATGNLVYFEGDDGVNGRELWKSDGTPSGTQMVKNIGAGSDPALLEVIGTIGNKIIFEAADGTHGVELWVSDGTSSGTFMLKDICVGSGNVYTHSPVADVANGVIYFVADDCVQSPQVWRTNGTTAGTYQVNNLSIGQTAGDLSTIDGLLYYSAVTGSIGDEMFVTNGQPGGTIYFDLAPGSDYANPFNYVKAGSKIYFKANHPANGVEVWSVNPPVISGVESLGGDKYLRLFPNPASDQITIDADGYGIDEVNVYSIAGKLMITAQQAAGNRMDISNLEKGIYLAEVKTGEFVKRVKWVKM